MFDAQPGSPARLLTRLLQNTAESGGAQRRWFRRHRRSPRRRLRGVRGVDPAGEACRQYVDAAAGGVCGMFV